jgi:hypothetical protein
MNGRTKIRMLDTLAAIAHPFAKAFLRHTVHQAAPEQNATTPDTEAVMMRLRRSGCGY